MTDQEDDRKVAIQDQAEVLALDLDLDPYHVRIQGNCDNCCFLLAFVFFLISN